MTATEAITRLREVIRRQHTALAAEVGDVPWLGASSPLSFTIPPALGSEQKLECFLTALILPHDIAASTQNQAFNAIVSFYKHVLGITLQTVDALCATRAAHLRHAPTLAETRALLQAVRDVARSV